MLTLCSCQKEPEPVKVTAVTLNVTSLSLTEGETGTISATVIPSNADNQKVLWSTDSPDIATVSDGVVTAVKEGEATITATSDDGGKTATCTISVKAKEIENPFAITSVGSTSVSIIKVGNPEDITLEYRKGTESWNAYTIGSPIDLADGEYVQFMAGEGGNANFSRDYENYYNVGVSGSGTVKVSGNIMSLLDRAENRTVMPVCSFYYLFFRCSSLVDAGELVLPAGTLPMGCYYSMFYGCKSLTKTPELPAVSLADYCYSYMFMGCISLTEAPELPATSLKECCYTNMFSGCRSLTKAPELPATILAKACYDSMFSGCTSLTEAPELPAVSLANYCYSQMFSRCTSLIKAPELPATSLIKNCYSYMFMNCTGLNYVKALFTTTPSNDYTAGWLSGVSSAGTFVKSKDATWDRDACGIPEGWTVVNDY